MHKQNSTVELSEGRTHAAGTGRRDSYRFAYALLAAPNLLRGALIAHKTGNFIPRRIHTSTQASVGCPAKRGDIEIRIKLSETAPASATNHPRTSAGNNVPQSDDLIH